ncbi:tripartite-type tricarboxylate transporter receptor subunit TctC [Acidovorax sp. 69]|uniref:Bug family tripartite tricarboxylate transporter substrate binding protein n=1 Tax=Acidovorax sp. 69 TaxID=2035202 RepID=UPI000C239949|nr:tripartite tricarboxylate transporter substrate binding protein [Acidovorax sp. 69]PJI95822.1 tripartite-type tricarboxylate transporter receptor subunit TctC [Acidovorax sp. 69]
MVTYFNKIFSKLLFGSVLLACAGTSPAQNSQQVIRVIVPYTAGGISDQVARGVVERMSKTLGRTMIIENKPGGGSRIGSDLVMRAAPDGNTLLFTNPSYSILPITDSSVKYDPTKALAPVALIGKYGLPIAVSAKLPVSSLQEFIAYAKNNPGKLSYGSSGAGSGAHFAGEFFMMLTKTEMVHIPYKSTSGAILDVASGVLDMTFDATAKTYADAGKVKIVAVSGDQRDPRMPNVPTAAESGLNEFVLTSWLGVFAPPGTPSAVIDKLNKAANAAVSDASFAKQVLEMGISATGGPPSRLANIVQQDVTVYRRIAVDGKLNFKE